MTAPGPVLALIPARGGSKSIPRKNLQLLAGRPLIAHSIAQALASTEVTRVIVSTDDEEIAGVARQCGAEVPFMRPAAISGDTATDLEAFRHALEWLRDHERYEPAICVHLRPTYPLRAIADIDRVVTMLIETPGADSVRSIAPAAETPFKMWFHRPDGLLSPVIPETIPEAYNLPRQQLPQVYVQNAAVDAVWSRVILTQGSMTGRAIYGYVMEGNFDIDSYEDFTRAASRLAPQGRTRT